MAFSIHSAIVDTKKYIGYVKGETYCLLNAKGDTLIKRVDGFEGAEFIDFNGDGYKDIILRYVTNVPGISDLLIYVPSKKIFKEVKNFSEFPAPEKIKGTNYYYSYQRSGCADMDWDSDLFYIKNLKAIRIGNISGRQCEPKGDPNNGIYIHKIHDDKKQLFKTLPIETISKYKDLKWGFIKSYWKKNFRSFIL